MKLLLVVVLSALMICSQQKFLNNPNINKLATQYSSVNDGENPQYNGESYWFSQQLLDHFQYGDEQYWNQRYFVQDYYFDQDKGPLFLFIGGEGPAGLVGPRSNFTLSLAEQYKGLVITLEHRFYGESQPFGYGPESWSNENMKYLHHEQALEDLATFIGFIKSNKLYGIKTDTPVITIGGSYPGALSAWFRYKYKHLTIGALASSAVVNTIGDYQQFDEQIRLSLLSQGQDCVSYVQELTSRAQYMVDGEADDGELNGPNAQAFKAKFGAEQLGPIDFLYFFADIFALQVQYGGTTTVCENLTGDLDADMAWAQRYAVLNQSTQTYDIDYMKQVQYIANSSDRQWTYQTCTYVGWFYTAAQYEPMRSRFVDLEYFIDFCQLIYGEGYIPNTQQTNAVMGGVDMRTENIIFSNGGQDPWKWASILEDVGDMKAIVIDCVDCAHCVDLHSPKPTDPVQLTTAREQIVQIMGEWISSYWKSGKKSTTKFEL